MVMCIWIIAFSVIFGGVVAPTTPPTDIDRCKAECDLHLSNFGYLEDLTNCHRFIQCVYCGISNPASCQAYVRWCAPGLAWNQGYAVCVRDSSCNDPGQIVATTTVGPCLLEEVPGFPALFKSGGNTMPCAVGTVFNLTECNCVHGGTLPTQTPSGQDCLRLHLEFDEYPIVDTVLHFVDNADVTTDTGNTRVGVSSGHFDGNGRLEINYFRNGQDAAEFAVAFWLYASDANPTNVQGIITNGGCYNETFSVALDPSGLVLTLMEATTVMTVTANTWTHVALSYDGTEVTFYIDAVVHDVVAQTGIVDFSHCPLSLGLVFDGSNLQFMTGDLDDVYLYYCALTLADVAALAALV